MSDWLNPASVSTRSTAWERAGTDATKLSVPVVSALPLVPPAICWLMRVRDTGADTAPTLSEAVTAVGALSNPESSVGCVTDTVKATSRWRLPAT